MSNKKLENQAHITAIVLAAGKSSRMGRPKMCLPWGETTVIGQVVQTLAAGGVSKIIVVTGGAQAEVLAALGEIRSAISVENVFNPGYADGEMLLSLQIGLHKLEAGIDAAMVALGDQPQIQEGIVRKLLQAYGKTRAPLIVPSYQLRRGHPWIVARSLWNEILALADPATMRDFLIAHQALIHYVSVENDSVLRDLDTPADYTREVPGS